MMVTLKEGLQNILNARVQDFLQIQRDLCAGDWDALEVSIRGLRDSCNYMLNVVKQRKQEIEEERQRDETGI